jgi:hypothetical protein
MNVAKLKHPAWVGIVLPIVLAIGATFSPEVLRALLLVAAVVAATWTFHKTEYASGKMRYTALALGVFLIFGIGIFFAGRALDARNKAHDQSKKELPLQAPKETKPDTTAESAQSVAEKSKSEAHKETQARTVSSHGRSEAPLPGTTVTNIAPGGIANSGTIGQATVNNYAPPPPVCTFTTKELPVNATDDVQHKLLIAVTCDQSVTSPTFDLGFDGNFIGMPTVAAKTGGIGLTDNGVGAYKNNGASSAFEVTMVAPATLSAGNELYVTVLSARPIKLVASQLKK